MSYKFMPQHYFQNKKVISVFALHAGFHSSSPELTSLTLDILYLSILILSVDSKFNA